MCSIKDRETLDTITLHCQRISKTFLYYSNKNTLWVFPIVFLYFAVVPTNGVFSEHPPHRTQYVITVSGRWLRATFSKINMEKRSFNRLLILSYDKISTCQPFKPLTSNL